MRITRLLIGLLALAVTGFVPLALAPAAQAVDRPITVVGTEPGNRGVFYVKGDAGADYAGRRLVLERRDRPSSSWRKVGTIEVAGDGRFKARIYRAAGSRKSCFRVRAKAVGGYDATTAKGPCIATT